MPTQTHGINTRIGEHLAQSLGKRRYELWIQPSVRWDFDEPESTLRVAVPNRFVAEKIRRDFSEPLREAARVESGIEEDAELRLELCIEPDRFVKPDPEQPAPAAAARPTPRRAEEPVSTSSLPGAVAGGHLRHRLDSFVVGPSNELAYAAAVALAESDPDAPRGATSGPLFLHGACGMGKTHLLQGICRRFLDRRPGARVLYTTAEAFTNAYIAAVRQNRLETFRKQMRRLDLLAVDDLGFFANKEKTQQEFQHCFDHIDLSGARLVLASDSHPKLIKQFSDSLVSRFVQGLVVQVHSPDPATRLALVHRLAQHRGLLLTPGLDERISTVAGPSVREIEGTLAQVHALACLENPQGPTRMVSRALIEKLSAGQRQAQPGRPVRFADIQRTVCDQLQVDPDQVAGSSRHRMVVLARAMLIHLTRQMTSLSFPEIAAALGKDSHSTVVTAGQRMTRQLEANQPLLLPGFPEPITPMQLAQDIRRQVLQGLTA